MPPIRHVCIAFTPFIANFSLRRMCTTALPVCPRSPPLGSPCWAWSWFEAWGEVWHLWAIWSGRPDAGARHIRTPSGSVRVLLRARSAVHSRCDGPAGGVWGRGLDRTRRCTRADAGLADTAGGQDASAGVRPAGVPAGVVSHA